MKKEHFLSIFILLVIWQILAMVVQNDILVPYPYEVLLKIIQLIPEKVTYLSIGMSILRILKGFLISFVLALCLVILQDQFPKVGLYFEPINTLLKTIPNVSYMILALIWLGSEGAISIVVLMILFPIFYNGLLNRIRTESKRYEDIEKLYPESFFGKLRYRTLPILKDEILSTSKTAISLALKVGVMAEILGASQIGIGRQLYLSKINLDTSRLFAWTLVMILLSIAFNSMFQLFNIKDKKEE